MTNDTNAWHLQAHDRLKKLHMTLAAALYGRFDETAQAIRQHSLPSIMKRIRLYESELASESSEPPEVIEQALKQLEAWARRVERGTEAGEYLTIPERKHVFAADKLVDPENPFKGITLHPVTPNAP